MSSLQKSEALIPEVQSESAIRLTKILDERNFAAVKLSGLPRDNVIEALKFIIDAI